MYKSFYKLSRNPFEITPDPSFLFPTTKHNEALAALYYGVRKHKGFVVLTGEVGTGKTMLLRCLLQLLKRGNDVAYAYIFNGLLSPAEFLQYVAGDFGLPAANKNKGELLLEIAKFVIARSQKNLTTLLVVDEAHQLSISILEEIRLLTNLETANGKLLQILLVGQPELDEKIDSFELRQLKQRIAFRSQLTALDLNETKGYVERRLQIAGGNTLESNLFPQETIEAIYHYSGGLPRVINTICENSLIAAYAKQLRSVTPDIVEDIAVNFRLGVVRTSWSDKAKAIEDNEVKSAAMVLLDFYQRLQPKLSHQTGLPQQAPSLDRVNFPASKQ
jgi:general secretion pathway protein A